MSEKILMQADGTLSVPDEPIIPYVEGDGTGVDIWPAAGAVVRGRAVAGEAPGARRHRDLPREHRGHLRGPRGRGGHAGGAQADPAVEGELRLEHPRGLRRRHQADLRDRIQAVDPCG